MILSSLLNRTALSAARNNHSRHPIHFCRVFSNSSSGKQKKRSIKSLALSVHFKHPDFGMNDYEILSRASAFLLAVDPPPPPGALDKDDPYAHLAVNERERQRKLFKQHHRYTPVGNPGDSRELTDLGWLEYAPREVRPMVHCVCSSHVLAPFLWTKYYPQEWLTKVRQEHCIYTLEVFDEENPEKGALGKFALNPYPIHHPEGRDVALIHLKDEEANLRLMQDLGVEVLYMRDLDEIYEKGDEVIFDGYVVAEPNKVDSPSFDQDEEENKATTAKEKKKSQEEDTRVFFPYHVKGELAFHTRDRFFATTPSPLPEGLCGGPALDKNGMVCGIVEGIVPKDHSNKDIAGSAAFMPNYMMAPFIDFAERFMLQKILPKSLFQKAVTAKTTGHLGGGIFKKDAQGRYQPAGNSISYEEAFDRAVDQLKKNHTKEEVEAILNTIQRERREVMEIMDKEGGDLDEVVERVRQRTMQVRAMIHEEYRKELAEKGDDSIIEAEVVEDSEKRA
ncbi:hypothetical protein IV203_038578 [Nitzschia inconspicua]|uniref:Uncharacterized protein n=1 Tax=Nitzschia inconspicua TaxID=303405 RepID=A0A9K3LMV7_9STRA|nr:hypothetical protein IV203_038578 [Nitzschia inconspicua]